MTRYSSPMFKKSCTVVFLFTFMLLSASASASSYYGEPPTAQPSSYAHHPRLCNFDDLYVMGYRDFEDLESCNVGLLRTCQVEKIYQLGDSISDVGNLIREVPVGAASPFARHPYGSNFPMGPTGRASNGNLMIDYFAIDAGLPLLPPFRKSDADFSHGVNFAVGGSTALPSNVLAAMNISSPMTTSSMPVQLDWMSSYFHSICHSKDCGGNFENAIVILGPFGGSDYHNALFQGKSFKEIETELIPKVVDSIIAAIRKVVDLGVKKVVVPGLYSISYLPIYRKTFPEETWDVSDDMAIHHNFQLRRAIDKLNGEEKPDAVVVYGDYFSAFQSLRSYSNDAGMLDDVCCGVGGGWYNFELGRMCGAKGVCACKDPQKWISWDGLHPTQESYRIMSKYMVYHMFLHLHCPYPQ